MLKRELDSLLWKINYKDISWARTEPSPSVEGSEVWWSNCFKHHSILVVYSPSRANPRADDKVMNWQMLQCVDQHAQAIIKISQICHLFWDSVAEWLECWKYVCVARLQTSWSILRSAKENYHTIATSQLYRQFFVWICHLNMTVTNARIPKMIKKALGCPFCQSN